MILNLIGLPTHVHESCMDFCPRRGSFMDFAFQTASFISIFCLIILFSTPNLSLILSRYYIAFSAAHISNSINLMCYNDTPKWHFKLEYFLGLEWVKLTGFYHNIVTTEWELCDNIWLSFRNKLWSNSDFCVLISPWLMFDQTSKWNNNSTALSVTWYCKA